jgi:hypothetical protein
MTTSIGKGKSQRTSVSLQTTGSLLLRIVVGNLRKTLISLNWTTLEKEKGRLIKGLREGDMPCLERLLARKRQRSEGID